MSTGKERYAALHGGVWIPNPDSSPNAPRALHVKEGEVVELYPTDAERINKASTGLVLSRYQLGSLKPVKDSNGEIIGEKNTPDFVADNTPALVDPKQFQKHRDEFEARKASERAAKQLANQASRGVA